MTAEHLLHELETLTYAARIRRMVDYGRAAIHDPEGASTLTTLAQGEFYERFLAIYSCFGSRDGAHVLRALADPSRIIRGIAINLVPLTCNEEQLRLAWTLVPHDGLRSLLWKLHHRGSHELIDEFLQQLVEAGDFQLHELLTSGSTSLVRRHITRLQSSLSLADWRRLARHHPAIAFELLQTQAAATTHLDLQLVAFVNGILPILARKQPDLAVTLVETLARSTPLSRVNLHPLLSQRPLAVADLALRETDVGDLRFGRVAHRLDNTRLLALQEKYPRSAILTLHAPFRAWSKRLTPEQRSTLSPAFFAFARDEQTCLPAAALALCSRVHREEEARRCLGLLALAAHPEKRLPYAAFLPWDEAYHLLEPFLHDPGEKVRVLALQTLVQITRYEHARLAAVLTIIRAHLHEPDPIRETVLRSLRGLPQSIWRVEHLDDLAQIAQSVTTASDTSANTVGALLLLLARVLDCAPEWSATHFARVLQIHHFVFRTGDTKQFSASDIRLLGPVLWPVLLSLAQQGDEERLLALRAAFQNHLRGFDALLDALELALTTASSIQFGNTVLSTFFTYQPERAARLIPELVQNNHGHLLYPAGIRYLHRYRQDLLTPFLTDEQYINLVHRPKEADRGRRRSKSKMTFLMNGFARWTAQQQTLFAQKLLQVIHDPHSTRSMLKRAIARLAALPAIPTHQLIALSNDLQPAVRELALIRLNKLDDTTAVLPTLLTALHDERAVRAMYALRPFLLAAQPYQALALLRGVPFTKVTIAKEIVRLLGDLSDEAAFQELLALDQQELHRDVRAELVRALYYHLGRDEAWQILEREARSSNKAIALSTVRVNIHRGPMQARYARRRFWRQETSAAMSQFFWFTEWNTITMTHVSGERFSLDMQKRLMSLFGLLLAHPDPEVRNTVLESCLRLPAADEEQVLLKRLLEAMDAQDKEICAGAASAIFGTCVASDALVIGQGITHLLPNRRALLEIVPALQKMLPINRQHLVPIVKTIIAALAVDPLTIELRIELAMASLPWNEVAHILAEAAATDSLHADALKRACEMSGSMIERYRADSSTDNQEIIRLEAKLAASHDERLRRIALALLVAQARGGRNWNAEQRARLQTYRADPSVLVASAAQFTMLSGLEA